MALAPGRVLIEKQKNLWVTPDALAAHPDCQCLKDRSTPQDMVHAALFRASKTSRTMTGQALVVDGRVVVTG